MREYQRLECVPGLCGRVNEKRRTINDMTFAGEEGGDGGEDGGSVNDTTEWDNIPPCEPERVMR